MAMRGPFVFSDISRRTFSRSDIVTTDRPADEILSPSPDR
jgi:hypothetical protein